MQSIQLVRRDVRQVHHQAGERVRAVAADLDSARADEVVADLRGLPAVRREPQGVVHRGAEGRGISVAGTSEEEKPPSGMPGGWWVKPR